MSVSHDSVKVLGETRAKWPSQALILTIEMGARDKVVSFPFERDCLISPVRTIQNWHPVFNSWGSMEKEAKRCYTNGSLTCSASSAAPVVLLLDDLTSKLPGDFWPRDGRQGLAREWGIQLANQTFDKIFQYPDATVDGINHENCDVFHQLVQDFFPSNV